MAAPRFAPVSPTDHPRGYDSPRHVPEAWTPTRPGELTGSQPRGDRLGNQGPDQGYVLVLARRFDGKLELQTGESAEDAVRGCIGVALRRASIFGRAPVIHDLQIAFAVWGFLDSKPPAELVELRRSMFEGVALVTHHYGEGRAISDMVPEATLRMSPAEVNGAYPARWRDLLGLS